MKKQLPTYENCLLTRLLSYAMFCSIPVYIKMFYFQNDMNYEKKIMQLLNKVIAKYRDSDDYI